MKRKFEIHTSKMICVVCGLVSFLQIGCQELAKLTGKSLSEIKFEKMVHDFGEVGPDAKQRGELKFTNVGEGLLKITKVEECCGVVTRLDKMKYAPGESGVLKVEWNSGPQESTMTKTITVHSNDPNTPLTNLTIKAKVVLQVDWEPKRLRLFLDENNAGCPKITINSIDDRPFSITEFKSTADCITADYDPTIEATEFVLEPKIDTEKLKTSLKGRVNISLNHPQGKNATILYTVVPKYTVNPSMIIIWDAQPEQPIVKKIEVLNNYSKDFEIESVSSKRNIIELQVLEQRKITNGYQLDLEFIPPSTENKTGFMDELSVNIKGGEKLTIGCNVRYSIRKPKSEMQ